MNFDETTQWAYESLIVFKQMLNIGKTWISCMVAMITRIKYFATSPLSYTVMTPYFYFMILKTMCSYTNIFELLNSLEQKFILFSFYVKIELFSVTLNV